MLAFAAIPRAGILLALILTVSGGVSARCQESAGAAREIVAAGWKAFECGDLALAEARFREATLASEAEGWLGLAEVARRSERPLEAIMAFREYISRVPDDEARRLDFARLLSWEGLHEESEFEFHRLADGSVDPAMRAAARRGLADSLAWSGRHQAAHALYLAELEHSPEDPGITRALGELESWHARHGSALAWFERSLAASPGDARTQELAEESRHQLRPEAFVRVQSFADDADWRRNKVLLGASGSLLPSARPDSRSSVAVEYASYQDASSRNLARRSLVLWHRERPNPFTALEFDAAYGEVRGAESLRGGVLAEHQWRDRVWTWASIRRDDWADPIAAQPFDRYNGAFTVDLLRGDIVQATTLRAGAMTQNAQGLGVIGEIQGGSIEDGNGRFEGYFQVHRNREYAPARHSIPRVYLHHLAFDEISPLYYSPESLDSWGVGWRWEAKEQAWNAYADAAVFWQTGAVDDYGVQLGVGVEREFDAGFRVRLETNFLSTDDRGLNDRYEAYALLLAVVVPF